MLGSVVLILLLVSACHIIWYAVILYNLLLISIGGETIFFYLLIYLFVWLDFFPLRNKGENVV